MVSEPYSDRPPDTTRRFHERTLCSRRRSLGLQSEKPVGEGGINQVREVQSTGHRHVGAEIGPLVEVRGGLEHVAAAGQSSELETQPTAW